MGAHKLKITEEERLRNRKEFDRIKAIKLPKPITIRYPKKSPTRKVQRG